MRPVQCAHHKMTTVKILTFCLLLLSGCVHGGIWGDSKSSQIKSSAKPTVDDITDDQDGIGEFAVITVDDDADKNQKLRNNGIRIPNRDISRWNLSDFLLVGTIDGSLQARDRKTGLEMWSIPGDSSMVKVNTLERIQEMAQNDDNSVEDDVNIIWIVEPWGDGGLYYFLQSTGLQKLPISIKQLVLESPFLINGDDKVYTGSRTTTLFSIDAKTGEIIKAYGTGNTGALGRAETSPIYRDMSNNMIDIDEDEDDDIDEDDIDFKATRRLNHDGVFMIGRTDYHLEIHNKSEIIWNVTFSTWGPNNMDIDLVSQHLKSPDSLYVTPLHENSILALSANSTGKPAMWAGSVPSIAVHIFDVFQSPQNYDDRLVLLPQPHYPLERGDADIGTYVDRTSDGHWFALSGANFPSLVRRAPTAKWHSGLHVSSRADLYNSLIGVHSLNRDPIYLIDNGPLSGPSTLQDSYVPTLPLPTLEQGLSYDNNQNHHNQNNQVGHYYGDNKGFYHNNQNGGQASRDEYGHRPMLPPSEPPLSIAPPSYTNSGWRLFLRLVENVTIVILIVFLVFVAARMGWLPQVVYFLESILLLLNGRGQVPQPIVLEDDGHDEKENSKEGSSRSTIKVQADQVLESSKSDANDGVTAVITDLDTAEKDQAEPNLNTDRKTVSIVDPRIDDPSNNESSNAHVDGPRTHNQDSLAASSKRRKRGSRGGKRSAAKKQASSSSSDVNHDTEASVSRENTPDNLQDADSDSGFNETPVILESGSGYGSISSTALVGDAPTNPITVLDNEEPLGLGSHGTVVFNGTFQNREVAVKRMVLNFYDLASQEISLLQESDDHPNVVRYYCSHQTDQFLYIALEKCPGTLEHVFTEPDKFEGAVERMNPVQILQQIASGLLHLHSLKIVHRDIKPQNILVAPAKKLHKKGYNNENILVYGPPRVLISDFGLCKRLEGDQSSFRPTTAQPAGTAGWTAPEISMGSRYPVTDPSVSDVLIRSDDSFSNRRLTRAVDIFSLGCLFYYVLSKGQHPFGPQKKREVNIEENSFDLSELDDDNDPDNSLAKDLISRMIAFHPKDRPTAAEVLLHPLFWPAQKKLDLLIKFSDRFEKKLATSEKDLRLMNLLEARAPLVIGQNWSVKLDKAINEDLTKFRKYHEDRLLDLIRAMRNKVHHFHELTDQLKTRLGPLPDGFLGYFGRKFPLLILTVYYFTLEYLAEEPTFKVFFEQTE